MRRAEFTVVPASAWRPAGLHALRSGTRTLALLGAAILAAVVAVSVAARPVGRAPVAWASRGTVLPVAAWAPVSRSLGAADPGYRATRSAGGFAARNVRQALGVQFSPAGARVRSGSLLLGMQLRAYGYGNRLHVLGAVAPIASGNRVLYRHGSVAEWYVNGPLGLEQGFTVTGRPGGDRGGSLMLELGLSGNAYGVVAPGGGALTFSHGERSLSYRGLLVTDARGRSLPARLQLRGRELLLRVDDADAEYPLRVDPFIQRAKLTASDGAAYDQLGYSVAVSGDTIVAGAPFATVNGNAGQGAVYVFIAPRGGWANAIETAKLTASDGAANDQLGTGVGISGDTVVAGSNATIDGHADEGAVYVFLKPWGGWRSETQAAKLTESDGVAGDYLDTVAIQGGTVVAGSAGTINGNADQGAVYVFLEPWGGWRSETQAAKLTASDGAAGDYLGWSVAIDGDTIAASAPFATINGNADQGAVYAFLEPRGGWRSETQEAKLTASDGAANDSLGLSMAMDGDTIVAGAPYATVNGAALEGAAYVFVKPLWGWRSETEAAKLTVSDGLSDTYLGTAVAVLDNTVAAGSPSITVPTDGNIEQGAAFVFVEPFGGWRNETETQELMGSDLATVGWLGNSLALSGETLVAGAPATTVTGNAFQGAVYVFGRGAGAFEGVAVDGAATRGARRRVPLRRLPWLHTALCSQSRCSTPAKQRSPWVG